MATTEALSVGINGIPMLSSLTGIGQYTYNLARAMRELDVNPWLFYAAGWRQELRDRPVPGLGSAKSAFKRFVPNSYAVQRFLLQCSFTVGARKCKLDIYHEPSFMAYKFKGPSVVTVHDLSWVRYPETHPADRVKHMNSLMPETVKRVDHILVDSEFVRREVIDWFGVPENKVTTTLLGVSEEFKPMAFDAEIPAVRALGLLPNSYILSVATLEPRKNLKTLVSAFAALPSQVRAQFPLVIVGMRGWGEGFMTPELATMLSRGEVKLTGFVEQADLPQLYAGARAFVYPSLYEGFGLPPLEAMASGVPVIASNRASIPEVVGDAGILLEALDVSTLTQAIAQLIEDDGLYARLRAAGLARSTGFTWRNCAQQTLDVYRSVLAQRGGR